MMRATAVRSNGFSFSRLAIVATRRANSASFSSEPILEVDGDLTQVLEVGSELAQHVVQHRLADQDDLDVERDGLGIERHGRGDAE